jgi:hypothetical protein
MPVPSTNDQVPVSVNGPAGAIWATKAVESTAIADSVMRRDAAGRAQVVDPSAAADIATKGYADLFVKTPAGYVRGDLIVRGAAGPVRFPVSATDGWVLTADLIQSNRMNWKAPARAPWKYVQEWGGDITVDVNYEGSLYMLNAAGPRVITLPSTGATIGLETAFVQNADGPVTFVAGAGAILKAPGGRTKLAGQYSKAVVTKLNYEQWLVEGDLVVP